MFENFSWLLLESSFTGLNPTFKKVFFYFTRFDSSLSSVIVVATDASILLKMVFGFLDITAFLFLG